MPNHATTVIVFLATILFAAIPAKAQEEWTVRTVTTDPPTSLGKDVRRIMAAGYYDAMANKTFVSVTGAMMVPQVAAFDHVTGIWGSPVSVTRLDESDDNHDYSHIFQLGDGHVGLTWSAHNEKLYFAKSENPHSIDGNWNVIEIGTDLGATYPMPMVSRSDGSISILYRVTESPTDYRPMKIVRSMDNGRNWSSPQPAIDYKLDNDGNEADVNLRADLLNEIYLGAMSYEADHRGKTREDEALGEGFHGTWTIAGGGGSDFNPRLVPDHKHDRFHKNMYYAFFRIADQNWYAADGTNLGTNITDTEAKTYAQVFNSGALENRRDEGPDKKQDIGYTSKAVLDGDGNPLVAFQNGKTNSIDIARWDGKQWNVTTPMTFQGTTALRDLALVVGKVWLLEDEGNGSRVVELQSDGSWADVASYSPETNANDNFFIDNANPEVFILAVDDSLSEDDNPKGGVYSVSRSYKQFELDNQNIVWLAEDLATYVEGSVCYPDNKGNCNSNGRMYTRDQADEACRKLGNGWRLPTDAEWQHLTNFYGGVAPNPGDTYEQLIEGGESGFNAQLGGKSLYFPEEQNSFFYDIGKIGYYWASDTVMENGIEKVRSYTFRSKEWRPGTENLVLRETTTPQTHMPCRCVKDK